MSERIHLGTITGAHGIRGEVKIRTLTEEPENVAAYGPLSDKSGNRQWTVRITGQWKEGVIAALSGVDNRTTAETLKNIALYAPASALPAPPSDEYYATQLTDLSIKDSSNLLIGKVIGVYDFGAGDVVEIAFSDGKTAMYPFQKAFFPEINMAEKWLRFEAPEEV